MIKQFIFVFFIIGQIYYSCHIAHDREIICYDNLKKAKDFAYKKPDNKASLDSALTIINKCMKCDSIKVAVVDLKISLLIKLGKLKEGSEFVSSLPVSYFIYPYKKKLSEDNFVALNFASNRDTISRNLTYRQMAADLKTYIDNNTLKSREFQEAFTDLITLTGNINNSVVSNGQIDSLKLKYPDDAKFLDFFKH